MAIEVYINYDGNCRDAVEFYSQVFQTEKPHIMTFGDVPANQELPITDTMKNRIMHTFLIVNESKIMFSDILPGTPFIPGNNVTLVIKSSNKKDISNWFQGLKEGGSVLSDLQETFFSKYYGFLTDKFGISWQFMYDDGE
ncbi:MAG: glyoxalase [Herbinix sp.]|jgi:PhnB protein|nr:glyoxalase [Herbinix sp.]